MKETKPSDGSPRFVRLDGMVIGCAAGLCVGAVLGFVTGVVVWCLLGCLLLFGAAGLVLDVRHDKAAGVHTSVLFPAFPEDPSAAQDEAKESPTETPETQNEPNPPQDGERQEEEA